MIGTEQFRHKWRLVLEREGDCFAKLYRLLFLIIVKFANHLFRRAKEAEFANRVLRRSSKSNMPAVDVARLYQPSWAPSMNAHIVDEVIGLQQRSGGLAFIKERLEKPLFR